MSGRLFDVYLTGARDGNPSVQLRLTASIAARYRLSAPVVAEALEGVACRVGAGLGARDAQAMVEALTVMGATARVSPAGSPFTAGNATPAPLLGAPIAVDGATTSSSAAAQIAAGGSTGSVPTRAPPPRPSDEFAPAPHRQDGRITLISADVETPLVVDVSEPIEFAEAGPDGRTGVRGPQNIRCPIHGLVYNRRKASGCVQCLAGARAHARRMREESRGHGFAPPDGDLSPRQNPIRRAFWGLGLALLVGFLPAAYYARRVNRGDLLALRARQGEIAALPATKETLAQFDSLDAAVDAAHWRGAGRTLLLWIVVSALTGTAWARLTRRRDIDEEHSRAG